MRNLLEMRKLASDPSTALSTLQSIAQDYPELRPALALNPSTYPDLLDWLRDLDEPEINRALQQRQLQENSSPVLAHTVESVDEDSGDSTGEVLEVEVEEPEDEHLEEIEVTESEPEAVPGYTVIPLDRHVPKRLTALADTEPKTTRTAMKLKGPIWLWLLVGLVAIIVIVVIVIAAINDVQRETVKEVKQPENSTPIVSFKPGEPSPVVTTQIPQGYDGPIKTVEAPGAHPGETLLVVVPALEDPSATAGMPSVSQAQSPTPSMDSLAVPAGAKQLSSFTTADGNIRCDLSASAVRCIVNAINVSTGCENRVGENGYVLSLSDGHVMSADCSAPSVGSAQGSLGAGESASNQAFACRNSADGGSVMCWNTRAGDGFILGRSRMNRFQTGKSLPSFQ